MADCIDPGAIQEEDLAAYVLDPIQDDALTEHIAHCPACAAQVDEMRTLTPHMSKRLSRCDCPTIDELDAYLAHELTPEQQAAIDKHLQQCSRCAEEVAISQTFLTQQDPLIDWVATPEPGFLKIPLRRIVMKLQELPNSTANPGFALRGTANLRGGGKSPLMNYSAEDVAITIRQLDDPSSHAAHIRLQGNVIAAGDLDILQATIPVRLLLVAEDDAETTPFAETSAEMGMFEIPSVPLGRYHLEVTLPDRIIVIETEVAGT